ncbi:MULTISPECIES: GIY-YIG nuclease family protein [unclassified Frankia]|uniref:GIY-YIG nuclease family protein n=1 Tax=unclassified Frankia TaxID=2632575 RepID=UPI0004172569|nr:MULTISPECIES: GIY-YIG nuclease family protein [unclassified Frankia]OHV52786.1 hypothetical protein CgIS1_16035 [Frankia sp. CgIS1]
MIGDLRDAHTCIKIAIRRAAAHGLVSDPDAVLDAIAPELVAVKALAEEAALRITVETERRERTERAHTRVLRVVESRVRNALANLVVTAVDREFNPHGCFVYLLWGTDPDRPLYVGKSTNILARLGQHMSDSTRRYRVQRVTVIRCRDGRQMDRTEGRLIEEYQPTLNIQGIH